MNDIYILLYIYTYNYWLEALQTQVFWGKPTALMLALVNRKWLWASLVPAPSAVPALEPPAAVCTIAAAGDSTNCLVTELSPLIGMIALYRKVAPSLATPARARHPFPVVALRLNLMVAESNI